MYLISQFLKKKQRDMCTGWHTRLVFASITVPLKSSPRSSPIPPKHRVIDHFGDNAWLIYRPIVGSR